MEYHYNRLSSLHSNVKLIVKLIGIILGTQCGTIADAYFRPTEARGSKSEGCCLDIGFHADYLHTETDWLTRQPEQNYCKS